MAKQLPEQFEDSFWLVQLSTCSSYKISLGLSLPKSSQDVCALIDDLFTAADELDINPAEGDQTLPDALKDAKKFYETSQQHKDTSASRMTKDVSDTHQMAHYLCDIPWYAVPAGNTLSLMSALYLWATLGCGVFGCYGNIV